MVTQDKLNIAVIQANLMWEDVDANLSRLEASIGKCVDTDLIVLPEMFSTGFSMKPEALAIHAEKTLLWMAQQAAKKDALLCGSLIVKEDEQYCNRFIWMLPSGEWGSYDKRHLFRMGGEHEVYAAGKKQKTFVWKGWRIAPFVCYDLRFPVWSRNRNHFDLMIYVANWPAARNRVWETLLQARAIENQCYLVGANRVGTDVNGVEHCGNSMVVDARGVIQNELVSNKEAIISSCIDKKSLETFREKFPVYLDADDFSIS
ncbi:amidohydrolase [Prolixibacteraceae bacterium JC049]|nr:amidohydrolase [Prolixibacteraceae bacterium JC049]